MGQRCLHFLLAAVTWVKGGEKGKLYVLFLWTFTEWYNVSVAMNRKMLKDLHIEKGKKSGQEQGCKTNRAEQGRGHAFDLQGGRVASLPSLSTPTHLPM